MRINLGGIGRWFMGYGSSDRVTPSQPSQVGKQTETRFRDVFEPGRTAVKPTALPQGLEPKDYDGQLLGPGGQFYKGATRYDDFPGFMPRDGRKPNGVALFINGVGGSPAGNSHQAQLMADATGAKVIGLYNATETWTKDIVQTIGDRLDLGPNAAVDSLASITYERIKRGEPTRLMGHSQGAMIISRGLQDVRDRLEKDGLSSQQIDKAMSLVTAETFGGAARVYPDGPKYTHYVNRFDPVTLFSGWALGDKAPIVQPGKNAKVYEFWDFSWKPSVHDPSLYLRHYRPEAPALPGRLAA